MSSSFGHDVVIASKGRPGIVFDTLLDLAHQTVPPRSITLSVTSIEDVPPDVTTLSYEVRVLISEPGLTVQRNAAINQLPNDSGYVTLLDDDIHLDPGYLENVRNAMIADASIAACSGRLLGDGSVSGEISREEAVTLLASASDDLEGCTGSSAGWAYGCNLTVRTSVAKLVQFDERLALYGWLEDRDFGARCLPYGNVVQLEKPRAVHLGVGSGRVSGRRFGFSQIVNPFYLWRKKSISTAFLGYYWGKALLGNSVGLLQRYGRVDRDGRLIGNCLGLREIAAGGGRPELVKNV